MADEVLSSAELETLLAARRPPREAAFGRPFPPETPPRPRNVPTAAAPRLADDVKQALTEVHERCAEQFAADLSALVRRPAQARLAAIVAMTHHEFVVRLDSPTFFGVLSSAPDAAPWLLEIAPAIALPLIDCMLGGAGQDKPLAGRPLTDIERRLLARAGGAFIKRLCDAWRDFAELQLAIERVEACPRTAAALKDDAGVIWVRFELSIGQARGMLNLGVAAEMLDAVASKLPGAPPAAPEASPPSECPPATAELVARLAESKIAPSDAALLSLGDVITTDQPVDAPIAVLQDGVAKFQARIGAAAGRKAIEIEDVLPPASDPGRESE